MASLEQQVRAKTEQEQAQALAHEHQLAQVKRESAQAHEQLKAQQVSSEQNTANILETARRKLELEKESAVNAARAKERSDNLREVQGNLRKLDNYFDLAEKGEQLAKNEIKARHGAETAKRKLDDHTVDMARRRRRTGLESQIEEIERAADSANSDDQDDSDGY